MGLPETIVLTFLGGIAGYLLGSGLIIGLETIPGPKALYIGIIAVIGALLGWYMGDYKPGARKSIK